MFLMYHLSQSNYVCSIWPIEDRKILASDELNLHTWKWPMSNNREKKLWKERLEYNGWEETKRERKEMPIVVMKDCWKCDGRKQILIRLKHHSNLYPINLYMSFCQKFMQTHRHKTLVQLKISNLWYAPFRV